MSFKRIPPIPKPCVTYRNKLVSYDQESLAPRPTLKLEDHLLSAVRDLVNTLAATVHIWRRSPPSVTWRCVVPCWQVST